MRTNQSPISLASGWLLAAALLANFAVRAGEPPKPVPGDKAQKEALALIKELHTAEWVYEDK